MASTDVVLGTTEDQDDQFIGILEFPFKDGTLYALPVHLVAEYPDDRRQLAIKHTDKKTGVMNLERTRNFVRARLARVLKEFGQVDGCRNPIHPKCSTCNRFRFGLKIAKIYKIDSCTCDEPKLSNQQMPAKQPYLQYLLDAIDSKLDLELSVDPKEPDQLRLSADIILGKARALGDAAFAITEATGDVEGNSES